MRFTSRGRGDRHGLTLVELLVVIVILVMLVGVTVPLVRSTNDGQGLLEATRQIESLLASAETRAIVSGRPAGVVFVRHIQPGGVPPANDTGVSYRVALAESPPPYAGDTVNARARLLGSNTEAIGVFSYDVALVEFLGVRPLRNANVQNSTWFVRPGDLVKFDYQGEFYRVVDVPSTLPSSSNFNVLKIASSTPIRDIAAARKTFARFQTADGSFPMFPFQIFRAPRRSTATPIELPPGSFVALPNSGIMPDDVAELIVPGTIVSAETDKRLWAGGDVMVTFGPSGELDYVYRGQPGVNDIAAGANPSDLRTVLPFRPMQPVVIEVMGGTVTSPTGSTQIHVQRRRGKRQLKPIDNPVLASVSQVPAGAGRPPQATDKYGVPD